MVLVVKYYLQNQRSRDKGSVDKNTGNQAEKGDLWVKTFRKNLRQVMNRSRKQPKKQTGNRNRQPLQKRQPVLLNRAKQSQQRPPAPAQTLPKRRRQNLNRQLHRLGQPLQVPKSPRGQQQEKQRPTEMPRSAIHRTQARKALEGKSRTVKPKKVQDPMRAPRPSAQRSRKTSRPKPQLMTPFPRRPRKPRGLRCYPKPMTSATAHCRQRRNQIP